MTPSGGITPVGIQHLELIVPMRAIPTWSFHPLDKVPRYLVIDVCLEQRAPYFAQRLVDIGFRQPALATQLFEDTFELVGQLIEHGLTRCDSAF